MLLCYGPRYGPPQAAVQGVETAQQTLLHSLAVVCGVVETCTAPAAAYPGTGSLLFAFREMLIQELKSEFFKTFGWG